MDLIAHPRRVVTTALTFAVGLTAAGCGGSGADVRPGPATSSLPAAPASSDSAHGTQTPQEDRMRITVTIGEQRFDATLAASAASTDLAQMLPVSIAMTDHGGVEKTGPLPGPLSLAGQPEGADPDVGDVGYYAPGNDLVLYYGDQGYYPGIVVLGRLDEGAADRIAAIDGSVTVTVEAVR